MTAKPSPRRAAVESWWRDLDDGARRWVAGLKPDEPLPPSLALDLSMAGCPVPHLGDGVYAMPAELLAFLAELGPSACPNNFDDAKPGLRPVE